MKGKHRAFVLIDVVPGKEKEVLEKLLKYEEVVEAPIIPVSMMCSLFWSLNCTDESFLFPLQRVSQNS